MLDDRFFRTSATGRPTEFGTIFAPNQDWLDSAPPEPVLDPDLDIVDSHHHLWQAPYRYDGADLLGDLAGGHAVRATVFVECGYGYRTEGPTALGPVGETERVVATTRAASRSGVAIAAGIVGYADLTLGARVAEVLDQQIAAGAGRFRGVRFSTGWDASPTVENTQAAKRPRMLREPQVRAALAELERRELSFDAWLFHPQLGEVAEIADAFPHLAIVLNHCGGPLGYGPYASEQARNFQAWRLALGDLAHRPNVYCKLGGLLARGAAFDYIGAPTPPTSAELARIWEPWINECIEVFGADRCMFESNFPVEKMGVPYATLWNAFKIVTRAATRGERSQLFAGTARRFYRLSEPAAE